MAKSRETIDIEQRLMRSLRKNGTFVCPEVTIGIHGVERVDMLAWDTDGTWRAYEIKVSLPDFRSKAAKSFVGDLNYFAMPAALYEQVKNEIPEGIGVWCDGCIVKRPTRRGARASSEVLMTSMMRSCYRDAEKFQKCEEEGINHWDKKVREMRDKHQKKVRSLRQSLDSYQRMCGGDYHHRDAMLDYWRKRAIRLDEELRIIKGKKEQEGS